MDAQALISDLANSPHADALLAAAAAFVVAVLREVWARFSPRWLRMVPVEAIARELVRAAVLETEKHVEETKVESGCQKLDAIQANNAKHRAIDLAEAKAMTLGVSLRKTIGDAMLRRMVDSSVRDMKTNIPKGA